MREIKFRVWDKRQKKMLMETDKSPWCESGDNFFYITPCKVVFGYSTGDASLTESKDLVFMQWTGLKDRNGVEVYEGDIVKGLAGNNYKIKFGEFLPFVDSVEVDDEEIDLQMGFYLDCESRHRGKEGLCGASRYLEVVGNIYENTELLEDDK